MHAQNVKIRVANSQIANFGKKALEFIELLEENKLNPRPTPAILRNLDNFSPGAFNVYLSDLS